ncbi:hypothetical protein PG995_014794 [Apiospora arundinis]
MGHLMADYSDPRYFIIGTNHESVKRHAVRKMKEVHVDMSVVERHQQRNLPTKASPSSAQHQEGVKKEGEPDTRALDSSDSSSYT